MSNVAIRVENLSKQYMLGATIRHDTLRDLLASSLNGLFRRSRLATRNAELSTLNSPPSDTIWALNDVSFEVRQGESLGIIGRNGAGKSTLLKILSRITEPTFGRAKIYGRVGSLLEVGTGFDRELTGRENIYLNGAILGMRKTEIDRKFDEIVDFSGVEQFIDTPVKRYSSGMYVRLAFAVAAHLEPEVLLVDEVLAVGDAAFQKKCLAKMGDVAKEGRTVLFISHNMAAVEHLCHKGIVLQGGKLVFTGRSKEVVDYYLRGICGEARPPSSYVVDLTQAASRSPRYHPLLKRLELLTEDGRPLSGGIRIGDFLKAHLYFRLENRTANVDACLGFNNSFGQRIFTAHTAFQPDRPQGEWMGDSMFVCQIPSLTLVPGEYSILVALVINGLVLDLVEDAVRLTINESDYYGSGKVPWNGMVVLKHQWYLNQSPCILQDGL